MKINYVLFVILFLSCGILSAQTSKNVVHHSKRNNSTSYQPIVSQNNHSQKNLASIIWSDDFSNPANWVIHNEVSNNDNWVIRTTGPNGQNPIPTILSTTASNGFALFDSDSLCGGNQIGDITNATAINCTGHSLVKLSFQQQYRRYIDSTFVFVSNDSITWIKYPVNVNLDDYDFSKSNPDTVILNISATAGNQAHVWVRFQFYSPSSLGVGAGCAYSWMIDDVNIIDLDSNDIKIGKLSYTYTQIPVGEQLPITLGAEVTNVGSLDQLNVVLNANVNTTFFTGSSTSMPSLSPDTMDVLNISTAFIPGALGTYTINFNAQQAQSDSNPNDNSNSSIMTVTDSTFAMDNNIYNPRLSSIDNGGAAGSYNSFEAGNIFRITNTNYATSVTFVCDSSNTIGGGTVSVKLYSVDTSNYTFNLISTSSNDTIQPVNLPSPGINPTSVTVLFSQAVPMTPGFYLATVSYIGSSDPFSVAVSQDQIVNDNSTWFYDATTFTWHSNDRIPIVRLNMNLSAGINEISSSNGVKLFQNEPNPFNASSIICYQLPKQENVSLTISDVLGRTIMNLDQGDKSAGMHNISIEGNSLSKGIYFYTLKVDGISLTKKMVITE
jgi:hypothetical protein